MKFKSGNCKSCEHRDQFIEMCLEMCFIERYELCSDENPAENISPCSNCNGKFYFIPEDKEEFHF